jgi:hypothetical protein
MVTELAHAKDRKLSTLLDTHRTVMLMMLLLQRIFVQKGVRSAPVGKSPKTQNEIKVH